MIFKLPKVFPKGVLVNPNKLRVSLWLIAPDSSFSTSCLSKVTSLPESTKQVSGWFTWLECKVTVNRGEFLNVWFGVLPDVWFTLKNGVLPLACKEAQGTRRLDVRLAVSRLVR